MRCRKCNVLMSISGTSYHRKEKKNDKGYRRYIECPNCHYRKYNTELNFQDVMDMAIQGKRNK